MKLLIGKYRQHTILLSIIICCLTVFSIIYPVLLTSLNLESLIMNYIFEAFLALSLTFIIITGGIDLSVSSVLPFSGIIMAILHLNFGMPLYIATLIALVLCAFIGFLNGMMINYLPVHPMIITLGMMLCLKGINLSITNGNAVAGFSDSFLSLSSSYFLGINIIIWIFILLAIVLSFLLNNHAHFRKIYYIGHNEKSAELMGIDVKQTKLFFYILSSVIAGFAGILATSRYGAAHWSYGNGAELKAIASVAIGGASLYGGTGSIGTTCLGAFFLAIIHNIFTISNLDSFWYDVINGMMLLIAAIISVSMDNNYIKQYYLKCKNNILNTYRWIFKK